MPTPIYRYQCPDCNQTFDPVGQHQHENGEWVDNRELRQFYQFWRWSRICKEQADATTERS